MTKRSLINLLIIISTSFTLPAYAIVVYDVSSTSATNCSGAAHGLWTNRDTGGGSSCSNFFDIQNGSTLTLFNDNANPDDWTAELIATAMNPQGVTASIALTFSDFAETYAHYKREGGVAYNSITDAPDIDFFTEVTGTIDVAGTRYGITDFVGNYAFQYGLGANAKNAGEYGASAWIVSPDIKSHHWDLNLVLTAVPEPSTWVLLSMGMLGISLVQRKRSK